MQSMTPTRRLRPAIAAFTAALLSTTMITTAVAESESPFGDAVRVADNALDTMRGGFSSSDGGVLRFGVNLETSVNGQPIGSVSISNNAQGKISATVQNLGRTFILQPDGTVQVKSTIPAGGASSSATSGSTSVAVTTLVPALPSSAPNGATLMSTGLLPSGNGIMTTIQNTRSNVVINALNTLNIQISGIGNPALRSSAAQSFRNSLRFSIH